jgi:acyl transferase domain-containing protein/acyl carrier protein
MTDAPAVAIVGMSGRFPGARDLGEYWANLRAGVCSISDFGEDELLASGVDPDELGRPDYVPAKGYLAEADRFEAELFGFNRTEAAALDPQHRLLLETAWSALEDAGYSPRKAPDRTGVYVGGSPTEHMIAANVDRRLAAELGAMQLRTLTDREFLAPWISYRLGLDGPSLTVQTACSTSLTAVHLAVQALLLGECDAALAGGVSLDSLHKRGYLYREGSIFSPDGRCRPFDEKAAGTVSGSGVGVLVLRRLEDALADGDPIRAVIRGTAVTNDGSAKLGFTAPSVDGQTTAIVEAWSAAGLDPAAAQYLEMHGTGTDLGDRIEVAAATAALGAVAGERCGIGSVKANIGHLDAAAGVASLIKVVLMLGHRTMVPTANVTRSHPDLALDRTPFDLVTGVTAWDRPGEGARLAGVTGLGIGGTNVHVVLAEAPEPVPVPAPASDRVELLPLSARTEEQLRSAARALAAALRSPDAPALADVGHTLRTGRAPLAARAQVLAVTPAEAADALAALADGRPAETGEPGEPAQLRELGAAWVRGADVEWPAPAAGARRVHLPTYPFAGESRGALTLTAPRAPEPVDSARHGDPGRPATEAARRPASLSGADSMTVVDLLSITLGLSGPDDLDQSYFGVGGDSLTAIHLIGRLRDEFGIEAPIELFLEPLTLRELATRISAIRDGADDAMLAALLEEMESQT